MINVIKTCSCFIDKAVWFVNLPEKQACRIALFDHVREQTALQDIVENKVIKEIRSKRTSGVLQNTIVVSCVECFYFQLLLLSIDDRSIFDKIDCRFVTSDFSSFGDGFDDDIYVGNSQFVVENYFFNREVREMLFATYVEADNFSTRPLHKSCFTSLQKKRYRFFCTSCKKIYNDFFESRLHVFTSTSKK